MDEKDFERSFMDLVERLTGRRLENESLSEEQMHAIVTQMEYLNALEVVRTSAQIRYIKSLGTLGLASSASLGLIGILTIFWSIYFWLK
jgi:hypothetical protein